MMIGVSTNAFYGVKAILIIGASRRKARRKFIDNEFWDLGTYLISIDVVTPIRYNISLGNTKPVCNLNLT